MKRIVLTILSIFTLTNSLLGVTAYPYKTAITVNGDTVYITLKGDENCKYAIDELGYTILALENGWTYADEDEQGNVVISPYKLESPRNMSPETKCFLKKTKKNITPHIENTTTRRNAHSPQYNLKEKKSAIGNRKALVILMQFQDKALIKSKKDFMRLFNEEDYTEDGAMGSVYDYYKWASYGQLNLTSDIFGPYTAKYYLSYYGGNLGINGNDKNPYELFAEAIESVAKDADLSVYDADGDGYIDNIHIIYAGYGEEAGASSNAIWAHEMSFKTITVQGMKIDRYSCAPELRGNNGYGISRIGPHCHEIGHALGAMDYYDTDYETGGSYQGTGKWDVMASGSWNNDGITPADFNPYVKIHDFGWTSAKSLVNDTINQISPSSVKGNIYKLNSSIDNEYFLLENRNQKDFHSAEPGKGLLIFHVGPKLEARASTNTINSTYPQQCYVVCASSAFQKPYASGISYGNINSAGCPYPGNSNNTEFNDTSTPASLTINGKTMGIAISGINFKEEDIVFMYSNNNMDNNEQTDTTEDVYLWGEDFEQLRLPSGWSYQDTENFGHVEVVTKLSENDSPQSPMPYSGKGYAKITSIPQQIIGTYRTSGCLTSPHIKLPGGKKYVFSLSARKYGKPGTKDLINVTLSGDNNENDHSIIMEDIIEQNNWKTTTIEMPQGMNTFSLAIMFDMADGSTLFIDNIKITEKNEETLISPSHHWPYKDYNALVYSLTGSRKQRLNHGINIIKRKDGTHSKIYIK